MQHVEVKFKRLHDDAKVPAYQSTYAAGLDLHAVVEGAVEIAPRKRVLIGTGLAIELPLGYEAQVRPRSGLANNHGITVLNSPGTIDADYRGEVKVLLINHGDQPFTVKTGERIAQLIVAPVTHATFTEVPELSSTERGAGGYGHTGK